MKSCGCHGSKRRTCCYNCLEPNLADDIQKLEERDGKYFTRQGGIQVKFGWFSVEASIVHDPVTYKTIDGRYVRVTEVTPKMSPLSWRYGDLKYVGLVTDYLNRSSKTYDKITWKDVFNSGNTWFGSKVNAAAVGKIYGYKYFSWNGWVCDSVHGSQICLIESID